MIPIQRVSCRWATVLGVLLIAACAAKNPEPQVATVPPRQNPETLIVQALMQSTNEPMSIDVSTRRHGGPWLLLSGTVNDSAGQPYDYATKQARQAAVEGAVDNVFVALLRKNTADNSFSLQELEVGSTDTPVELWIRRYALPSELTDHPAAPDSLQWQ